MLETRYQTHIGGDAPSSMAGDFARWRLASTKMLAAAFPYDASFASEFVQTLQDERLLFFMDRVRAGVGVLEAASFLLAEQTHGAVQSSAQMIADESERADVGFVCALHDPELTMLLQTLPPAAEVPARQDDSHVYHASTMTLQTGETLRVIAGAPTQMGLTAATVLTTKMILRWRPRLIVMTGIAAGVRQGRQGFGDIVAAEQTYDWGAGKISEKDGVVVFASDRRHVPVGHRLLGRLKEWERTQKSIVDIQGRWTGDVPRTALKLRVGPIASGAAVVNSRKQSKDIVSEWRKLAAIEMESFGVHSACREATQPEVMFLCAKSICDFAAGKTDGWQRYAAFTSAQFALAFVTSEWRTLFP